MKLIVMYLAMIVNCIIALLGIFALGLGSFVSFLNPKKPAISEEDIYREFSDTGGV